jgi:hypothetical protein
MMRATAARLDGTLGPDQSSVVYTYADGWTVRRLTRREDQLREGALIANCLRDIVEPDPNCFSLRDVMNLPHASFSAWAGHPGNALIAKLPNDPRLGVIATAPTVLIGWGRAQSRLKPAYTRRLREFGASPEAATLDPFPTTFADVAAAAEWAIAPAAHATPDPAFDALRRLIVELAEEEQAIASVASALAPWSPGAATGREGPGDPSLLEQWREIVRIVLDADERGLV